MSFFILWTFSMTFFGTCFLGNVIGPSLLVRGLGTGLGGE